MLAAGRQWFRIEPASSKALANLCQAISLALPSEYLALLSYSNGGEGPLPVSPYNFCLDPAEITAAAWLAGSYSASFPGFLVFGSSGGGEYIAFDLRSKQPPWPVVALDMTNTNLTESVIPIAKEFSSFLGLLGVVASDA